MEDPAAAGLRKKEEARAALQLKKEQAQAAKQRAQADRAALAEKAARDKAADTTTGIDVAWNLEFTSSAPGSDGADDANSPATAARLDIWREPRADAAGALQPVVLWLHGGAWRFGTHHTMPPFLRALTSAGYAIVSVGYRKSKVAKFPACLHDCKAAVRFVRRNGPSHGLDPELIGVLGNSAGGHLAAMLGLTAGIAELEGEELGWASTSSEVRAVTVIAGPSDLATSCIDHSSLTEPEAVLLGGAIGSLPPEVVAMASPLVHARSARLGQSPAPPFLLVHGDADEEVALSQSEMMLEALTADGGSPCTLFKVEGGGHIKFGEGGSARDLAGESNDGWCDAVVSFFDEHLK